MARNIGVTKGSRFIIHDTNQNVIMGLQSCDATFNGTYVDATNIKSAGWREDLGDGGKLFVTMTGTGIFKDSVGEQSVMLAFYTQFAVQFALSWLDNAMWIVGNFKVTKLSYSGTYNGVVQYSLTLESSGACQFYNF